MRNQLHNNSTSFEQFVSPRCPHAAVPARPPYNNRPAIPARPDVRRTRPGGRTGRDRSYEFDGICAHFTACVRQPQACARQPEIFLPGSTLVAQGWITAWTVCSSPASGMPAARAPGPVVNGPARAARNVRGTSRGGPPDAGWGGRVGRCRFGRFGFRIAQKSDMLACLNQGLQRKWVCCRLRAIFWPAANRCPRRVVWSSV